MQVAHKQLMKMPPKNNPEIYLKMARIWKRASKMDLAEKSILDGLKINDKYAPLYKDLIEIYMEAKQYDKILPTLEKYIPLAGNDFSARRRLVTFLTYQAKDYDRAVLEAEKLLKDDPTQTTMYRWIAWAKSSKADNLLAKNKNVLGDDAKMLYKESQEASKKLFELVPADRLVYYDYEFPAKAALKLGNIDEAAKLYKTVVTMDSSRKCDVYSNLIKANYDAKKFKEGFALLDEKEVSGCAVDKNTDYYYAMYYAYAGKLYAESVKYADKYIANQADLTDGYYYKGLSQTELDDDNAPKWLAKETYEKLASTYDAKPKDRSKPHVTKALMYLAYYYGSVNDFAKAREFAQKTVTIEPTHAGATKLIADLEGK
jgi:tetratricopeptide (TPR) repeat protein